MFWLTLSLSEFCRWRLEQGKAKLSISICFAPAGQAFCFPPWGHWITSDWIFSRLLSAVSMVLLWMCSELRYKFLSLCQALHQHFPYSFSLLFIIIILCLPLIFIWAKTHVQSIVLQILMPDACFCSCDKCNNEYCVCMAYKITLHSCSEL